MQCGRVPLEQNKYFKISSSSTTPGCLNPQEQEITTAQSSCRSVSKKQYLQPFSSTHSSVLSRTPTSEDDAAPWFVAICKERETEMSALPPWRLALRAWVDESPAPQS